MTPRLMSMDLAETGADAGLAFTIESGFVTVRDVPFVPAGNPHGAYLCV